MAEDDTTAIVAIPDETAAPDEGELPGHFPEPNNLAGDAELCDTFRQWAFRHIERYKTQAARQEFIGPAASNGSEPTISIMDKMRRVSLRKDETSAQNQNTKSNVASTSVFRALRTITAAVNTINFPTTPKNVTELPAEYEPEVNSEFYTEDEGREIAERRNLWEQYVFDEDKREEKIRDMTEFLIAYGQAVIGIEWDLRKHVIPELRVPKEDRTGFTVQRNVVKTIADWPTLRTYDIKDVFMDALIDDMEEQFCVGIRAKRGWMSFADEQREGCIMNVGQIQPEHLYVDRGDDDAQDQRELNAGEQIESDRKTGQLETWYLWGKVPIKEYTGTRKGKGTWKPGKVEPQIYRATFVGPLKGPAVCVSLVRNPHPYDKMGLKLAHTHRDNKGAYHMGFATILPPLYWQAVANQNQTNDNITANINGPLILDGNLQRRTLLDRQNQIIKVTRGTKVDKFQVPDMTSRAGDRAAQNEDDIQKTIGADKPVAGEVAFARTSATQATQNLEQALQPLDDLTAYIDNQVFIWMLEEDAAWTEKYANPDTVRNILNGDGIPIAIKPTELWGPVKTKVVAVTRFRNNITQRREMNLAIQNFVPLFREAMGLQGLAAIGREAMKMNNFTNYEDFFPFDADGESRSRAFDIVARMLMDAEWTEPQPSDNHMVHIGVATRILNEALTLPKDEQNQEGIAMLRNYIAVQTGMMEEAGTQPANQGQSGIPGAAGGPALEGEMSGDQLGAEGGALAQV